MELRDRMKRKTLGSLGLALFLLLVMVLSVACARIRVESGARDAARLADYEGVVVLPVVAGAGTFAEGSDLADRLSARAEERLAEAGYRPVAAAEAQLAIQLTAAHERPLRRTWSSDPDANAYVLREIDEAVLSLRAIDRARDVEIWRADARSPLRDSELLFSNGPGATWMNALEELMDAVPAR